MAGRAVVLGANLLRFRRGNWNPTWAPETLRSRNLPSRQGRSWARSALARCFFAFGNFGQFVYVAPDRDAVLVRFGTAEGNLDKAS